MADKAPRLHTCLDVYDEANLSDAVGLAQSQGFNFIRTNIIHDSDEDGVIGRGPHEMSSIGYQEGVQCRVKPGLDVDALDPTVRKANEALLKRHVEYATFLGIQVLHVDLTEKHSNLALILQNTIQQLEQSHNVPLLWMSVPLCGPPEDEFESFRRWEAFRDACGACTRIWVSVVIPENIPDQIHEILNLWMAEQVSSIVISTRLFIMNANNFPVLPKCFQMIVKRLMGVHPVVTLTDAVVWDTEKLNPKLYLDYMSHMFAQRIHVGPLQEQLTFGFQDSLQIPLQPLADHLESVTYEIFEKDPVKYAKYKEALMLALQDLKGEYEKRQSPLVVMVVGAGRGPLVTTCLQCSREAEIPLKLYAVEKNPSAVNVLRILNRDMWQKQVTVVDSDMRTFTPEDGILADILVSELLGSWGDNELSPECLDGAQRLLKTDGISIPSSYASYVNPVQCPMMHRQARDLGDDHKPKDQQLHTPYVVYFRHVNHLADIKKLFEFSHPNKEIKGSDNTHNERMMQLTWESNASCVFHGFAGYFDCVLYKDVVLSIHPETHSRDMNSWFPMFIPIHDPQPVKKGEKITATFWRKTTSTKVWYQWMINAPQGSVMHNVGGRCSSIGLAL